MLNRIIVQGRMTRDPELRRTANGVAVCTITLACERDYRNSEGTHDVDFFDIICWRNNAEYVSKYGKKGRLMNVDGKATVRYYVGNDGVKRKAFEIESSSIYLLDTPKRDSAEFVEAEDDGTFPF